MELLKQFFEILSRHFSAEVIGLIILCCCLIYIWYQHLRLKLLREHIDLDEKKRESLFKISQTINERDERKQRHFPIKQNNRILIVDDEKMSVEIVEEVVSGIYPDAQIEKAYDGLEALQKIRERLPNLLISDIVMPRMTGLQLLKTLHEENKDIPTIIISGYLTKDVLITIRNMQLSSATEIIAISKPFEFADVIEATKKLLKSAG